MKKIVMLFLLIYFTASASENSIFNGSWCVEDEGFTLTFSGKDSVEFSSEDDETISGAGTFSFDDTTLSAVIDNEGIVMEVNYGYTYKDEKVMVVTNSIKVNGDTMEVSSEEMTMVRCGDSVNDEELSEENPAFKETEDDVEEEKK